MDDTKQILKEIRDIKKKLASISGEKEDFQAYKMYKSAQKKLIASLILVVSIITLFGFIRIDSLISKIEKTVIEKGVEKIITDATKQATTNAIEEMRKRKTIENAVHDLLEEEEFRNVLVDTYKMQLAKRDAELKSESRSLTEVEGMILGYDNISNFLNYTYGSLADSMKSSLTLSACRPDQFDYEIQKNGKYYGAFIYYFVEGLNGVADFNRDGRISFVELHSYIASQLTSQTPVFYIPQESKFVLAGSKFAKQKSEGTLFLFLVALNKYANTSSNLRGCLNDAYYFSDFFSKGSEHPFREVNVKMVLDEQGTKENILKMFQEFIKKPGKNDTILFFYAGHGMRVKTTTDTTSSESKVIIPHDFGMTRQDYIKTEQIAKIILETKAKNRLLIFDSAN